MVLVIPIGPRLIHGAVEIEKTQAGVVPHRLPGWVRARHGDGPLAQAGAQPSGVRLVFYTTASALELIVRASRPEGIYDLLVNGRLARQASSRSGAVRFQGLQGGAKKVEIWLPHDGSIELVALRSTAPIVPIAGSNKPRWLHHGGAINQGANAVHPTGTWPAVAAARGGVDLLNLGLRGNALLDPLLARTIRDLPADLISLKIGIDLVSTDLMRLRAFGPAVDGFLDTIREGHPATPLFVVSPLCCPIHEDVPGPTHFEPDALAAGRVVYRATGQVHEIAQGKLTLGVVRQELDALVRRRAATDIHLHYLDGRQLFGPADCTRLALRDALHPGAASHRLIGERFADLVLTPSHATVAYRTI